MASKRCLCSTIIQAARAVHGSYFQKHFHWSILVVLAQVRTCGILGFAISKTTPLSTIRCGLQVCIRRFDDVVTGFDTNDLSWGLLGSSEQRSRLTACSTPSHALWELLVERWHGQYCKGICSNPHEVRICHYLLYSTMQEYLLPRVLHWAFGMEAVTSCRPDCTSGHQFQEVACAGLVGIEMCGLRIHGVYISILTFFTLGCST